MAARSVQIVEHRPGWGQEFLGVAGALRAALGDLAVRIDHVGSTAVPGLAAKDVIDVQVTVRDLRDERLMPAVASAGFRPRADIERDHVPAWAEPLPSDWEKRYATQGDAGRRTHIHIRQVGRANQRYALLFRDFLRGNGAAAAAYEQVKRTLASAFPHDSGAYADAKDPVCDLIMLAAREWERRMSWVPGDPDA